MIKYCIESEKQNGWMVQNGFKCIVVYPCDCVTDWELHLTATAHETVHTAYY